MYTSTTVILMHQCIFGHSNAPYFRDKVKIKYLNMVTLPRNVYVMCNFCNLHFDTHQQKNEHCPYTYDNSIASDLQDKVGIKYVNIVIQPWSVGHLQRPTTCIPMLFTRHIIPASLVILLLVIYQMKTKYCLLKMVFQPWNEGKYNIYYLHSDTSCGRKERS